MDENQIRKIVQDEMGKNYRSGSTQIPPHTHDGNNNVQINPVNLKGFSSIPTTSKQYLNPSTGKNEYGYGSVLQLEPGNSSHSSQYINDTTTVQIPIPIVVGNGAGTQGEFNGGYAPDGTVVLFSTGSPTLSFLYVRFNGQWYGISVDAII